MSRQASRTGSIRLKAKSSVPVHYTFTPGFGASEDGRQLLIVCLNGLCDPMKVWNGTLKHLAQFRQSKNCPSILTYDRFGCGKTGPDPSDAGKGPTEWHDLGDVAKELHELLLQVYETELGISSREKVWPIFVAHSIGTAVAQLYGAKFPGEVVGYLLLDATLTDSDGTSLMPDPDAPGFDATALPRGVTPAMLRDSRMKQHSSPFNRNMPNTERLRWNNIQEYIPVIGAPKFTGPAKGTPLITLMMHDDQVYAKQLKQVCENIIIVLFFGIWLILPDS